MSFELLNHMMLILLAVTCTLSLFARLRLPSVLGYLCVGVLVGPEAFNILSARHQIEFLSEIGIILMMFMAGLEFSWPKLRQNLKSIVVMGAACVGGIAVIVMAALMFFGMGFGPAFLIGGAVAMSSTALVSKQLMDQNEFYASHGRIAFNLALFQDLATLVFLVAVPALAHTDSVPFLRNLSMSLATMCAVFIGLYFAGRHIERPLMKLVGALKSNEIFVLTTLLIILGAAWISNFFYLPGTIGAFLAGMIIGETEFKYKIEEDIRPFRDILMGIFFMGMGVTIKISVIAQHLPLLLCLLFVIIIAKLVLTVLILSLARVPFGSSLRIGLILAHCGEFSLLLIVLGMNHGVIGEQIGQVLMVAFVLSLMISTMIVLYNQEIAFFLQSVLGLKVKHSEGEDIGTGHGHDMSDHIILCGFGETGKNLRRVLGPSGLPLAVIETDPQKVDAAVKCGCFAIYGDAANLHILKAVGLDRAKALVITFDDYVRTLKILHNVRTEYPGLPIIVRIHHISHVEDLLSFGATSVLPDGIGTGMSMGQEIMKALKLPGAVMPDEEEKNMFF